MDIKRLTEELYLCAEECDKCYDACQKEDEKEQLEHCMMLDKDCADICRITAQVIDRGSDNADLFLKLCGEICEKCAAECEHHSHLQHCKECARVCRECAEMCNNQVTIH